MPAWLFAALLGALGEARADASCTAEQVKQIRIGAQIFSVEVAASVDVRARGLSGRSALRQGTGLWFVFPAADMYGFWMHDMRFPIDLIWVSPELTVADAISLQPCIDKNCPVHYPPSRVRYVLEINAGTFAGKPGDSVAWRCAPDGRN
jgi:uncharacterized membrane protein (UPF0127 family)